MRIFRQLSLLAALTIALPAGAEIYRWTNEAGETSFGSNPPAGVDAEPVSTGSTNTIETGSKQADEEDRSASTDNEQSQEAEADGETQEGGGQQDRETIREQNCEAARQALETLKQNARVQVMEDGERRYLSPEEKEAERERYEKIRDENCD
ncbi:DUF4124 domain-containing protein [Vreelandella utahensis]|uniref:DUF4124 domain-containing protein n=1 Tax=Vreelandella halophila TaxID=86177 RepID=UPI000986B8F5|nr:DUF4124 domain-containing protein [Halomonas utahensis]